MTKRRVIGVVDAYDGVMFVLARRVAVALGAAGLIAALFRLRGGDAIPPQAGGWRELGDADI
ncbi:MAG: hypothetical protein ACK5PP_11510 [Acidimicrobiales bacterium]